MYKKDPIQDIRRGLHTASIISFLRDHPEAWKVIFATKADEKLHSDLVVKSLKCDPSVGDLTAEQEMVLNWLKDYVGDLPSDTGTYNNISITCLVIRVKITLHAILGFYMMSLLAVMLELPNTER